MEIQVCANVVPCLVGTIIPQSVVPLVGKGWVWFVASSQSWCMAGIRTALRLPRAWRQSVFEFGHGEQWAQGRPSSVLLQHFTACPQMYHTPPWASVALWVSYRPFLIRGPKTPDLRRGCSFPFLNSPYPQAFFFFLSLFLRLAWLVVSG